MQKFKFTKTAIAALPSAPGGKRVAYHDNETPHLVLRVSGSTKSFYYVKRVPGSAAYQKWGTFPAMTVEQARQQTKALGGDFARGIDPREKKKAEKADITLG